MDEKLDGLGARVLQDLLIALSLQLYGSSEPFVVLILPHLLRSSSEDDGSTGFLEEEAADEAEGPIYDELHPFVKRKEISSTRLEGFMASVNPPKALTLNPTPSLPSENKSRVNGGCDGSENGSKAERTKERRSANRECVATASYSVLSLSSLEQVP